MSAFPTVNDLAAYLRQELESKKYILLFAYNGTGKTRLSMAFKDLGKQGNESDTLYFNAFTEDLYSWDNDLEADSQRILKLNSQSRFFAGLEELEMDTRIRSFLHSYADFDFTIDYGRWEVTFKREVPNEDYAPDNADGQERTKIETHIKVSRGEENLFIWCFFLAIVQLAMDGAESYRWVKNIYIDDPISSLDEHNAIAVASNLAQLLKKQSRLKTVISSHHSLFFNVLYNELTTAKKYFLTRSKKIGGYVLQDTGETPFFHHVAALADLYEAEKSGKLYTYHFSILRTILEKSASFHGYKNFSACIKQDKDDPDGILHARLINILSHGNYSLYEPQEMLEENKAYFKKILQNFLENYAFNPELFPETEENAEAA